MLYEIALAANPAVFDPSQAYELSDLIRVAVAVVVLGSGALSVLFIIWGGVMLILSGGKDDKVKPAVNSIRYAVVGVIIIIISLFVVPRVGDLLGLNVSQYLAPGAVFETIQELSGRLFGHNSNNINIAPGSGGGSELPADFSDL